MRFQEGIGMRTIMNVMAVYLAVLMFMFALSVLMSGYFTPLTLFLSPAVVSALFLVTALSENDERDIY